MPNEAGKRISRRRVLTWGGLSVAALAAGGIGWQFRPTIPPTFPEIALDAAAGKPKLLIAYGSRLGSTAEQAVWMSETAASSGFAVEVARAENAPRAEGFDAVILGSAVRSSSWLPEAIQWAADNGDALAEKPYALFEASISAAKMLSAAEDAGLSPKQLEKLARHREDLDAAAPILKATPIVYLPGCLDYEKMPPALRFIFPIASGTLSSGDFRDRNRVAEFTTRAVSAANV
jgi:menaquinone-dependent protoporphyrinogen oxidase